MKTRVRIPLLLIGLLLAACLSFVSHVIAEFSYPVASEYANRLPFNSSRWKAGKAIDPLWPDRLRMVDHLLDMHSLVGITRSQVVVLLGQPDDTEYFRAPNTMVYFLGPERGAFRIDSEWLVIELKGARVTSAEIRTD